MSVLDSVKAGWLNFFGQSCQSSTKSYLRVVELVLNIWSFVMFFCTAQNWHFNDEHLGSTKTKQASHDASTHMVNTQVRHMHLKSCKYFCELLNLRLPTLSQNPRKLMHHQYYHFYSMCNVQKWWRDFLNILYFNPFHDKLLMHRNAKINLGLIWTAPVCVHWFIAGNLTADIPKDLKIVRDEDFELDEPRSYSA